MDRGAPQRRKIKSSKKEVSPFLQQQKPVVETSKSLGTRRFLVERRREKERRGKIPQESELKGEW